MRKFNSLKHSRAAQTLVLLGLTAVAALAQSGDLSAATAPIQTAGVNVIKLVMALVLLACVGVIAYGALCRDTCSRLTHRPQVIEYTSVNSYVFLFISS